MMANRFISPTPSTGRERSAEITSPVMKHDRSDKMSLSKLLSPPESPETAHIQMYKVSMSPTVHPVRSNRTNILTVDEPLLPIEGAELSLTTPLFAINEHNEAQISKVLLKKRAQALASIPRPGPSDSDYGIFIGAAWRMCKADPRKWWDQEARYREVMKSYKNKASAAPGRYHPYSAAQRPAAHQAPAAPKPPRRSKAKATGDDAGTSPAPAQRVRHAAPNREDSNWQELPDICPDTKTLDGKIKLFAIDWRGTPLPIENELYFDQLHPAEAKLASILRLTPAIYLSSKRRMFIGKLHRVQAGKEFRKTDAQKACAIDVNKASRLWQAFEKVGWLDVKHIEPYRHQQIVIPEHLRRHPAN